MDIKRWEAYLYIFISIYFVYPFIKDMQHQLLHRWGLLWMNKDGYSYIAADILECLEIWRQSEPSAELTVWASASDSDNMFPHMRYEVVVFLLFISCVVFFSQFLITPRGSLWDCSVPEASHYCWQANLFDRRFIIVRGHCRELSCSSRQSILYHRCSALFDVIPRRLPTQ